MKKVIPCIILISLLAGCVPNSQTQNTSSLNNQVNSSLPAQGKSNSWWNDAVFYEIFVRSFYDSNGDGIGDFNGITQKLDYLQTLGINALWLMPVYPSPSYHGYDVTDYFNVNPDYGTMDDFKTLLTEAHERGMKVILDLELNHTSDQNPWFTSANAATNSAYRNWYIWSDTEPAYTGPLGLAWFAGKSGYYYGVFGAGMPDLNYTNPAVTTEMDKVVAFWLNDIGVDGFRLDAINYLIEEGEKQINTASTHAWLKGFYKTYKSDNPGAFTIGEVYGSDASLGATYTGDQMDMVFDFEIASSILNSTIGGSNSAINSALTFAQQSLPDWQFGTFLTNHDQNRTMSTLSGNIDQAKTAAFLLLTAPGTPFIYYGEEIGMQGEKPDENIRLPMQWSADTNAGFTTGIPWEAPNSDYLTVNVVAEENDKGSLLGEYSQLISIRRSFAALRDGGLSILSSRNSAIYATLRYDGQNTFLVLANLGKVDVKNIQLSLPAGILAAGNYSLQPVYGAGTFSDVHVASDGTAAFSPLSDIPAYAQYILQFRKQ